MRHSCHLKFFFKLRKPPVYDELGQWLSVRHVCGCVNLPLLGLFLPGWHLVVYLWIKQRAFKGWVNTVPLLHQSFYASIHPSIHGLWEKKHSHSSSSGVAVICVTTTWCCRNKHIPDIPLNPCVNVRTDERIKTSKSGEKEQLSKERRMKGDKLA